MNSTKIFNFFNSPRTALLTILIFLISYFLAQGFTTGFGNNFLTFGPTNDEISGKPTTFMGIQLESWSNVGLVYFIIFISTVLQVYYNSVVSTNIHSFVWNAAIKVVPFPKFWTYLILLIDPIIEIILYIIRFYATATFQLQYIIPQFIGSYITDLPFTLKWLNGKTFIG
jgi:hypothetical protein